MHEMCKSHCNKISMLLLKVLEDTYFKTIFPPVTCPYQCG